MNYSCCLICKIHNNNQIQRQNKIIATSNKCNTTLKYDQKGQVQAKTLFGLLHQAFNSSVHIALE
jgi:hypothetical protein